MKKPIPFGKYLLLERVNVGGMAEVFLAKAFGVEGFERILAIKRILPTMVEDEEFITMFLDEARISVQLNHANIVQIYELGKHDDSYYIAMEYVSGKDVRQLLERYRKRKETMPTAQAVLIASKICEGLDYAHRKKDARGMELNIIHRDVSPQNILVSYEGEIKIIDFGIAKAANRAQKTQAGILKGKFGYMSPEQVRGLPIDHRSDVFAVGVILYEMLTGERLFVGESDFSTLEKVRNADVLPPRQYNSDIPVGLEKIIMKALARDVEDRYQWCADMQEDLMRYLLSGETIYSSKQLMAYMKQTFADDVVRERGRLEQFSMIERPAEIEISGLTATNSLRARPTVEREAVAPAVSQAVGAAWKTPPPQYSPVFGQDPMNPVIPPVQPGELDYEPSSDRTELFQPRFHERAPAPEEPTGRAPMPGGADDEELTATPVGPPRGVPARQTPQSWNPGGVGDYEQDEAVGVRTVIGLTPSAPAEQIETRPRLRPPVEELDVESDDYEREPTPVPGRRRRPAPRAVARDGGPPMLEPEGRRPTKSAPRAVGRSSSDHRRAKLPMILAISGVTVLMLIIVAAVMLKQRVGTMVVMVEPKGHPVLLTIDGHTVSPGMIMQVPAGEHLVKAQAAGFVAQERRVSLAKDAQLVVELVLLPESALAAEGSGGEPGEPGGAAPGVEGGSAETGQAVKVAEPEPKPAEPATPVEAAGPVKVAQVPEPTEEKPVPPRLPDLKVESQPTGAEIEINGKRFGKTPRTLTSIDPSKVKTVTLVMKGYARASQTVEWDGMEPVMAVYAALEKLPEPEPPPKVVTAPPPKPKAPPPPPKPAPAKKFGKLVTMSKPVARLSVDGKDTGRWTPIPPAMPLEIAAGTHTLTFTAADGRVTTRKVTIPAGETVKVVGVSDFK